MPRLMADALVAKIPARDIQPAGVPCLIPAKRSEASARDRCPISAHSRQGRVVASATHIHGHGFSAYSFGGVLPARWCTK